MKLRDWRAHRIATDPDYAEAARELDAAQALADRVVALRVAAGLTQTQLAKKAGIKQPHLSRLEAGADNPTLETLEKVGNALGVRLDYTPPQMSLPLFTMNVGALEPAGFFTTAGVFLNNITFVQGVVNADASGPLNIIGGVAVNYVEDKKAANADHAQAA